MTAVSWLIYCIQMVDVAVPVAWFEIQVAAMTFRVEDPEVPSELRDLAQCSGAGSLVLPFSQEPVQAPLMSECSDVQLAASIKRLPYMSPSLQLDTPHDREAT